MAICFRKAFYGKSHSIRIIWSEWLSSRRNLKLFSSLCLLNQIYSRWINNIFTCLLMCESGSHISEISWQIKWTKIRKQWLWCMLSWECLIYFSTNHQVRPLWQKLLCLNDSRFHPMVGAERIILTRYFSHKKEVTILHVFLWLILFLML